jgi:hypothetical protein
LRPLCGESSTTGAHGASPITTDATSASGSIFHWVIRAAALYRVWKVLRKSALTFKPEGTLLRFRQ